MSKNKNINTSINADIFNLDDDEENEVIDNTIISNDKVSSNGKSSSRSRSPVRPLPVAACGGT